MSENTMATFRLTGSGWADIELCLSGRAYLIQGVSYTTDALGDLARAALMIATGAEAARLSFDGEPMETRLVFSSLLDPVSGQGPLSLTVLLFADIYGRLPDANGDKVFVADCPALDFARAVLTCLQTCLANGVQEEWTLDGFPLSAMRALETALAVRDLPPPPPDPGTTYQIIYTPKADED